MSKELWAEGKRVECRYGPKWRKGTVERANQKSFWVKFDDTQAEEKIQDKEGHWRPLMEQQQPKRRRRGIEVKCGKCKGPCKDMYAGNGIKCGVCEFELAYQDPVDQCDKCKWHQCVFCKTGEVRPVPVAEQEVPEEEETDDEFAEAAIVAGKSTGVPKQKRKETPRETQVREEAYVRQREKDRILNAQTRGLPGIIKKDRNYPPVPHDAYAWIASNTGYVVGGKCVPIMIPPKEQGNGYMLYQAVDFTAAHPSGLRKSFRRGQRIWATDDMYPANYKPVKKDWSLIVLHLAVETHGGKHKGYPTIHAAPWAHINKDRCNVSRFVLKLTPGEVKTQELHICPLIEEDTHHCKFTTVSHTDFMVVQIQALAAKNASDKLLANPKPIVIEELSETEREEEVDPKAAAAPKEADTKKRKR